MIPREVERYQAAGLAELGIDPEKLARLTDKQIHLVYRHPREKTGELRIPAPPRTGGARVPPGKRTLEEARKDLRKLAKATGMKPGRLAEQMAKLEAKYNRGAGNHP